MIYLILYLSSQILLFAAWVSGALDPYQKMFQEMILDAMGENQVSYALKMSLTAKKLTEDENFNKIQNQLGGELGGVFDKSGPGGRLGSVLNKSL